MRQELHQIATEIRQRLLNDPFLDQVDLPWLKAGVTAYPERGGKALRPALLLWSCGACGGDPQIAWQLAAACEIFHTWTLVHDDIIDCDDLRRGKPSVHKLIADTTTERLDCTTSDAKAFGTNMAILAGDIQQAWSNSLILNAVAEGAPQAVVLEALARMNRQVNPGLICGEAMDVEFELRPFGDISSDELERMLTLKTGLLLRYAAEVGAMVGTGQVEHPLVHIFGEFAAKAGLAFQLRDDVLGLLADEHELGKPVGSDIRKGKRTMLVAVALEQLDIPDKERLLHGLGKLDLPEDECAALIELIRQSGAVDVVESRASALVAEAQSLLDKVPAGPYRDLLRQWADYVCNRTY